MNFLGACVIAFGFAASVLQVGAEIRGTVCLKESGSAECVKVIDSVRICCFVRGEYDSIIAWTDSLGKFRIPIEEPAGRKTLIVSKVGFLTVELQNVIVTENKTTYVTGIQLKRSK